MKTRLLILSLFLALNVGAAWIILFDPTTGRNLQRRDVIETLDWFGRSNVLVNPPLPTNSLSVCKVTNLTVVPLNAQELLADWLASSNISYTASVLSRSNLLNAASTELDALDQQGRALRFVVLLTLDQINFLRRTNGMSIITTQQLVNAISNAVRNDPR